MEACVIFRYESDRKSYLNDKVHFLFIHKLKFQIGVSKHVSLFILHESLILEPEQSDHTWAPLPAIGWLSTVWSLHSTDCLDQDWAWYSVGHKFYSLCIGWLLQWWFLPLYPCHFHHHVFFLGGGCDAVLMGNLILMCQGNEGIWLPLDIASYSRRTEFVHTQMWKPHNFHHFVSHISVYHSQSFFEIAA